MKLMRIPGPRVMGERRRRVTRDALLEAAEQMFEFRITRGGHFTDDETDRALFEATMMIYKLADIYGVSHGQI